MTAREDNNPVVARWVRAGVSFGGPAASECSDLERLLLDTSRQCEHNARLFVLAVTWLVRYGTYIARHRLRCLAATELEPEHRPVLGLILDSAVEAGAPRDFTIVTDVCEPASQPRPLFAIDRDDQWTARLVEDEATEVSRRWKRWVQPFDLKFDAIRPAKWIISRNPSYGGRAVRRGDLRCSILEVLRRDAIGCRLRSESELTRKCSANRTAVRDALDELEREGYALRVRERPNKRDQPIELTTEVL